MFTLQVPVNKQNHMRLKASVRELLPDVKSSHRLEAIARGMKFETYAAFCAQSACNESTICDLDCERFAQYLRARDFNVRPELLYLIAAFAAIDAVMEKWPNLTAHGMALDPYRGTGRETPEHYSERFAAARGALLKPEGIRGFLCALAFLERVKPIRSINRKTYTYKIKHVAERYNCAYPNGAKLGPFYVSNGVLIAAAAHKNFAILHRGHGLPSAWLNVSERSIADLDCEIRQDGARAQDKKRKEQLRELSRKSGLPQNRFSF